MKNVEKLRGEKMVVLLNILVIWFLLSIPVSLLAARVIKTRGMMIAVPTS